MSSDDATPQRRASDNGAPSFGRRGSDLAGVVQKIIESMPEQSIEKHDDHHAEIAKRLKEEQEAKEYWNKLKKQMLADIVKYVVAGAGAVLLSMFVLGANTKFNELVNKAVDAPRAPSRGEGK